MLTVYWFNPLSWLAYVLLCRDIEMACDEKVIRDISDILADDFDLEAAVVDSIRIDDLRTELDAWKDWASEMLDYYLQGEQLKLAAILSEKHAGMSGSRL